MISKEDAEALYNNAVTGFWMFNDNLISICEARAWEPLGFPNLPASLRHYFPGLQVSIHRSKVEIIWASDDATEDEIINAGAGITRHAIQTVRGQKRAGVPKDQVQLNRRVKRVVENINTTVFAHFELSEWDDVCAAAGGDTATATSAWALSVLRRELAR